MNPKQHPRRMTSPGLTLNNLRDKNHKQNAEVDNELMDSNGRPFQFDSLFGTHTAKPQSFKQAQQRLAQRNTGAEEHQQVNQGRLGHCLSQLGPPIEDRLHHQSVATTYNPDTGYNADASYIPGTSDPWSSIHFNVSEGLEVAVSHRTRIDCGLPPRQISHGPPNRRQQNILDAAFEIDLYEERSKVINSEQSVLFLEKSRELKQRKMGLNKHRACPTLQKKKSALSLKYLI